MDNDFFDTPVIGYHAFLPPNGRGKFDRLQLVLKGNKGRSPSNHHLIDMAYFEGTHITLIYSHCLVEITGKNLEPLYKQLGEHRVESIYEFDPKQQQRPANDKPIIEKIEVLLPSEQGE